MLRVLVMAAVWRAADPAAAETTYVDPVVVLGGVDGADATAVVVAAVSRAGVRASFGTGDACDDSACLGERARASGAARAVRVTIADLAGTIVASLAIVDPRGRMSRHTVTESSIESLEAGLASALLPRESRRGRRTGWLLAGGAAVAAIAGAAATWRAYDLRAEFYDAFVDPITGDVIGISQAEARRAEARARRWSIVGLALLGTAAVTGVAATVILIRDPGGEVRGAGIAVAGDL